MNIDGLQMEEIVHFLTLCFIAGNRMGEATETSTDSNFKSSCV
jgi:hypothetical protein